mmetsp:Transcript_74891/g.216513  ORF Transcript_74891/g.216513 Transcript_74891/m.216513 type:complete len:210 (-) Transcript_74891:192-821(-)
MLHRRGGRPRRLASMPDRHGSSGAAAQVNRTEHETLRVEEHAAGPPHASFKRPAQPTEPPIAKLRHCRRPTSTFRCVGEQRASSAAAPQVRRKASATRDSRRRGSRADALSRPRGVLPSLRSASSVPPSLQPSVCQTWGAVAASAGPPRASSPGRPRDRRWRLARRSTRWLKRSHPGRRPCPSHRSPQRPACPGRSAGGAPWRMLHPAA